MIHVGPCAAPVHSRAFRWNAGGWFGSVAGGVAWMLPLAWQLADGGHDEAALATIGIAGLLVAGACVAFRARHRLSVYLAIQGLVVALGVSTVVVGMLARRAGLAGDTAAIVWGGPLLACGLFLMFMYKERFSSAAAHDAPKSGDLPGR